MEDSYEDKDFTSFTTSSDTKVRGQRDHETFHSDLAGGDKEPPWKLGDNLGSFILEHQLGKGSSGHVYRAFDQSTGRRCALKLLLPAKYEDLIRNKLGFRRMMALRSPALMTVDRIHQLGRYVGFSMEEIKGTTFAKWALAMAGGNLDYGYDQLLSLLRQYASGLATMHAHGLVHRDIKPLNLMVDHHGNGRVIDYGLVGTIDVDTDPKGYRDYLVGPQHFFAPETLWDQFYLPASDVFSLGLVLLETLKVFDQSTGKKPVCITRSQSNRLDDQEMISDAFGGLSPNTPDVLREACMDMLQSDPGDRPSAAELARLGSTAEPMLLWSEWPMVGRTQELRRAQKWIDEIFDGGLGRLHIDGVSGIGKTRFLDELEHYVKSKRWGQLFRARCRRGEDQPLQAFDQICDAIATRYMKSDREMMEVDPVSTEILHTAFPVLKKAVRASMSVDPARKTSKRLDALEAGVRLSEEMRIVGPLIMVIDDAHWADRDSLNMLDRFQSISGGMLGLITVSSLQADRQRVAADLHLTFSPIDDAAASDLLHNASRRFRVTLSESLAQELIQAAAGNPFRLIDFTEEFRAGGLLHQAVSKESSEGAPRSIEGISQLWRLRVDRLSKEAKSALSFIVTSPRPVSTEQLRALTRLGDSLDAAVSELTQQRLVTDEASGGECISIVQDSMAESLATTLSSEKKSACHRDWAEHLVKLKEDDRLAARIAGHYFSAGQSALALPYAILAAENAERFVAKTEAARWHARVIDYLSGEQQAEQIRRAAEAFAEADWPTEAAKLYQRLALLSADPNEQIHCQMTAASLLICSGHFADGHEQIRSLAAQLRLPIAKPIWRSKLSIMFWSLRYKLASFCRTRQAIDSESVPRIQHQRLQLCLSASRPLSMFDNLYAMELNTVGAVIAIRYGSELQRLLAETGAAVFNCYDGGASRVRAELALQELLVRATNTGDTKAIADVWAGIANSHVIALRWNQVHGPLANALQRYRAKANHFRFEIAHSLWMELWAHWNLGRWRQLSSASSEMVEDSVQRNDLFQQKLVSSGLGASAWLVRDECDEHIRIRREIEGSLMPNLGVQLLDFTEWIANVHFEIYQGEFSRALEIFRSLELSIAKLPFSRFQLARVTVASLGALIHLHLDRLEPAGAASKNVKIYVKRLHHESNAFASTLARFYEGMLAIKDIETMRDSDKMKAKQLLYAARESAKQQKLRPLQLAAEDAISLIDSGRVTNGLIERMIQHGVRKPQSMSRLYTPLPYDQLSLQRLAFNA